MTTPEAPNTPEGPATDVGGGMSALAAKLSSAGFDLPSRKTAHAAAIAALEVDGGHAKDILAAAERCGDLPQVAHYLAALTASFAPHIFPSNLSRTARIAMARNMLIALEQEENDDV